MTTWTKTAKPTASWTKSGKVYIEDYYLLETGDKFLLETSDKLILRATSGSGWTKETKPS
jgi:hypothetical protein